MDSHILNNISHPTLVVDKEIAYKNISRFVDISNNYNIIFRPHFKTHQSKKIGEWFRNFGVNKITVSSLRMANYFADAGWEDITIAFPVNIREIELIKSLSEKIKLNLLVEDTEVVDFLRNNLTVDTDIYIKIDAGARRTGILAEDITNIKKLAEEISNSNNLKLAGLLVHSGESYGATNATTEFKAIAFNTINKLNDISNQIGEDLIISYGDTPTLSVMNEFTGIDEMRPGNFVFYDLMQYYIGACKLEDIAVKMFCPVVAKHSDRNEIVIYGGATHFSKDSIMVDGNMIYGEVTHLNSPELIKGNYLKSVSQVHGILKCTEEFFKATEIGDLVAIYPIHSCLTANLMQEYIDTKGEKLDHFSSELTKIKNN